MADEFGHISVGPVLTQAEWESTSTHQADGQTEGDFMIFSGGKWIRSPRTSYIRSRENFVIYKAGSSYNAFNQLTSTVDSTDTDAGAVMSAAFATFPNATDGISPSGGLVDLLPGIFYDISTPIIMSAWGSKLQTQGHRQTAVIRQDAEWPTDTGLIQVGGAANHVQGCEVEDVFVLGGGGFYNYGSGIMVYGSSCHVVNVETSNIAQDGIVFGGGGTTGFENIMDRCHIVRSYRDGLVGTADASDNVYSNSFISGGEYTVPGTTVTAITRYGINMHGGSSFFYAVHPYACEKGANIDTSGYHVFTNCAFESNTEEGVYITGAIKVYFDHSRFFWNYYNTRAARTFTEVDAYIAGVDKYEFDGCSFDEPGGTYQPADAITRNLWVDGSSNGIIRGTTFGDCWASGANITVSGTSVDGIIDGNLFVTGALDTAAISIILTGAGVEGFKITNNICAGLITEDSSTDRNTFTGNVCTDVIIIGDKSRQQFNRTPVGNAFPSRQSGGKGPDVAAASALVLGQGTSFEVSAGTGTIDFINVLGWDSGLLTQLILTGAVIFAHNTGSPPANCAPLYVPSGGFTGGANDIVTISFDGDNFVWRIPAISEI